MVATNGDGKGAVMWNKSSDKRKRCIISIGPTVIEKSNRTY